MTRGLLPLTLLLHGLVLAILYFSPNYRGDLSTIPFDFGRGTNLISGQLMYRDFSFEYPPLAALFYATPRLFADTIESYRLVHAIQMGLIDLVIAIVTLRWLQQRGRPLLASLLAQVVFLIAAGVMIVLERFDLGVALLTLLALTVWPVAGGVWSWAFIALGMGIKLYPGVLAPLLVVDHLRRRDWLGLLTGVTLAAVLLIVPFVPWILTAPESLGKLFEYHLARGIQIESFMASLLLIGRMLGEPVRSLFAYGSQEVASPNSPLVANLALPLLIVSVLGVTWRYARGPANDERRLRYASAAILGFALFNKVLSAQYMIWLYPLLPLIQTRRYLLWGLYAVALGLTQYLYPHGWIQLTNLTPEAVAVQMTRNGLLLVLWLALVLEPRVQARRADERDAGPTVTASAR